MCVCFTLVAILPEVLSSYNEVLHQARQIFIFTVQIPDVSKWFIIHTLYYKVLLFCDHSGSLQAKGGLAWQKLSIKFTWQLEFSMYKSLCVRGPPKRPRFAGDSQRRSTELSTQVYSQLWLTTVKTDTAQSPKRKGPEARPWANQGQASPGGAAQNTPEARVQPARYREALQPRRPDGELVPLLLLLLSRFSRVWLCATP